MWEDKSRAISVAFFYDGDEKYARPTAVLWQNQEYELAPVTFWHTTRHNGVTTHHYTVNDVDQKVSFRLALETENMHWALESAVERNAQKRELRPLYRSLALGA